MKIVVITGSAHKNGTSACLAENFIKGAEEAGHEVYRFVAAFKDVHPCLGCDHCYKSGEGCVFKDAMTELNPRLIEADAVVFVSPIYYYNINAQIKAVVDRFYANDAALHGHKKTALLTTMADDVMKSADAANLWLQNCAGFLEWEVVGTVNAMNSQTLADLEKSDFPKRAYELGKSF